MKPPKISKSLAIVGIGLAFVPLSCAAPNRAAETPAAPSSSSSLTLASRSSPTALGHASAPPAAPSSASAEDAELDRVAAIHGAPGPWAVAGYRMGRHALAKLGLAEGSFDLEITHHTPRQVMYSCIADGAAAATGASVGKLNLQLVDSSIDDVETTYRKKSTGESITLRPAPKFRARFADTSREQARELGRQVLRLPDAEVFEVVPPSVR